MGLQD
jgi:hypothetical protein